MKTKNILWFDEINKDDIPLVGGKGANLGEMIRAGIPVPFGYVVTAQAYFSFIEKSGLSKKIKNYLSLLDCQNPKNLQEVASNIQKLIINEPMPEKLAKEIMTAYLNLSKRAAKTKKPIAELFSMLKYPFVAVRSSATAEDLPTASFAGQQETFLNVLGEANVVKKVQEAWASLYTPRAIFYREEQKFDHLKVGIAVPVQLMVNSQKSGVMFTVDPVTSDKKKIIVEAIYGLGELIVQGAVTPDHFEIDKKTLEITAKQIGYQNKIMVRKNKKNVETKLKKSIGGRQKITDKEAIEIAKIGKLLEKHYYFPQDIEWAIEKDKVYVVQTRPITTIRNQQSVVSNQLNKNDRQLTSDNLKLLLKGDPASPGIVSGQVKVILSAREIGKVIKGDILVAPQTNPDYVPAMKRAVAIVTEQGGRTSHAAIVSRELGIPAIVGAQKATKILTSGMTVTVNGAKGEVYKGMFIKTEEEREKERKEEKNPENYVKTSTKVYVNLATPHRAKEVAGMNVDGVGLLRAEFMIADIGIHPKKLIKDKKENFFINRLADDLLKLCKPFNPRPVVYRATDFKTNEYRNLVGGKEFEPEEPNPMLGYRGAYRYISDPEVFQLELEAIKKVRNKNGFKNLWLMIPFVRTVEDLIEVKKIVNTSGLSRSSSFKLWMMVEIPSNVILLDKFCEAGIDGVSIGSNDLTMLILGTDRDNHEVSKEFDERNPAVTWAIERVIKTCRKYKVTSSICGQAPSDYPELVDKLVSWGITSMSVNPDAVSKVRKTISEAEKKLVKVSFRT